MGVSFVLVLSIMILYFFGVDAHPLFPSHHKGWFAPIRTDLLGKRKVVSEDTSQQKSATGQTKKSRTGSARSIFNGQPSVGITKKEEDANIGVQSRRPEAGQASAEREDPHSFTDANIMVKHEEACMESTISGDSRGETKPSQVETATAKLVDMLPLSNAASISETRRIRDILVELNEADEHSFTRSIVKTLQKPVKTLCSHIALGGIAESLLQKLKASYSSIFVRSLKTALADNETQKVQKKLTIFYKKLAAGDFDLDEAFILKHSLIDLLAEISLHLHDKGVMDMTELIAIQNIVNENVELEDSTDV